MTDSGSQLTWLGIYLTGLGLNFTPCVYPMLSVTLSLFSLQKDTAGTPRFIKALIYVLGIVVMNTALGTSAALTGGILGSALQNRWVLIGISGLLFGLSLSMFGVYSVQVPSAVLNRITAKKAAGWGGLFVSGMVVGLFAAPCIGPPMLALLTIVSAKGNALYAAAVFFILSLGLGTPYLFLAVFSGAAQKLPRSGPWLLWIERLFGVILLALSAFYLLLALKPDWIFWIVPVFVALGGIYLGFLENTVRYGPRFNTFRKVAGVMALLSSIAIAAMNPRHPADIWEVYTPQKISQAQSQGQAVILDFYADWCIPCHELDRFTYSDPKVIQALAPFARYKVNLTDESSDEVSNLVEQYGIEGVPTVLFLDSSGKEIEGSRLSGFLGPDEFLKWLKEKVMDTRR